MARRQALHRPGRQMYLGPAERQGEREASHQSAQILVQQCRGGDHEWRRRDYLSPKAATTGSAPLLASGWAPIYPCHVSPREMRSRPIGTGPFKFIEFKPNEVVRTAKNPDYWKPGRPYLDGIEWHIMPDRSTRNLTFIAGRFDVISPYGTTLPSMQDIKAQVPQA